MLKKRLLEIISLKRINERIIRSNISAVNSTNIPFKTHSSAKDVFMDFTFIK
jgi:hypothetical protein